MDINEIASTSLLLIDYCYCKLQVRLSKLKTVFIGKRYIYFKKLLQNFVSKLQPSYKHKDPKRLACLVSYLIIFNVWFQFIGKIVDVILNINCLYWTRNGAKMRPYKAVCTSIFHGRRLSLICRIGNLMSNNLNLLMIQNLKQNCNHLSTSFF